MALIPVNYEEGQLVELPMADAQTLVKGGVVVPLAAGYYGAGSATTAKDVQYVSMVDVVTTATGESVLCLRTQSRTIFEADTDANPARTDVGMVVDLASLSTINPDAVTNQVFYIEDIVGAVADKKVRGYFIEGERGGA